MAAVVKKLALHLKNLKKLDTIMTIELIEDELDNWLVTFLYPESKKVIIKLKFHLLKWLPPKATVVFPKNIQWVCFEELGTKKWNDDTNLYNLLLCLHCEYSTRCAKEKEKEKENNNKDDNKDDNNNKNNENENENDIKAKAKQNSEYQDDKQAIEHWNYVKRVHSDWEMIDIDELNNKMDQKELEKMKNEAKKEWKSQNVEK